MTSTESTESRLAAIQEHIANRPWIAGGATIGDDECEWITEAVEHERFLLAEVAALQARAETAEAYIKKYEHSLGEINVEIGLYRGAYGPAGREEHIAHIDSIIDAVLLSPPSTPPDHTEEACDG